MPFSKQVGVTQLSQLSINADLVMGAHNITLGAGQTVDGVDVSSHQARHVDGGADELAAALDQATHILRPIYTPESELGGDDQGANSIYGNVAYTKFTAGQSAVVLQVSAKTQTQAGNGRMAIYADSAGAPAKLVSESGEVALATANSYTTFTLQYPVMVILNTVYWVALQHSNSSARAYYKTVTGAGAYEAWTYGAFPATATPTASNNAVHEKVGQ